MLSSPLLKDNVGAIGNRFCASGCWYRGEVVLCLCDALALDDEYGVGSGRLGAGGTDVDDGVCAGGGGGGGGGIDVDADGGDGCAKWCDQAQDEYPPSVTIIAPPLAYAFSIVVGTVTG
jgi:hypothetical protein